MPGCVLAGRFVFSDPAKNTAGALRRKGGGRSGTIKRKR